MMSGLVMRISLANWLSCRLGLYRKIPGKTLRVSEQLREEFQPICHFGRFGLPAKALHRDIPVLPLAASLGDIGQTRREHHRMNRSVEEDPPLRVPFTRVGTPSRRLGG